MHVVEGKEPSGVKTEVGKQTHVTVLSKLSANMTDENFRSITQSIKVIHTRFERLDMCS